MINRWVETIINWKTTPDELRKLADKMEIRKMTVRPGTTTCVRRISITDPEKSPYIELHIHYKQ